MTRKVYNNYGKNAIEMPKFDLDSAPVGIAIGLKEMRELMGQGVDTLRDGLQLYVIRAMIDAEIGTLCAGSRYQHNADRANYRHGKQRSGFVVVGGRKIRLERTRVVTKDGRRSVPITSYQTFQKGIDEKMLRNMLYGVSTRNYERVLDSFIDGYGVKRSTVSRNFVRSTKGAIKNLCERPLEAFYPVILVDGYELAGEMMIVALGINPEGIKTVLSIRQGCTENSELVGAMFAELAARGVDTNQPCLFVVDGSKAIAAAILRNFPMALTQRCQIHKERNILSHAQEEHHPEIIQRLRAAWQSTDLVQAREKLNALATWAGRINPDLAGSIREGLEETLTVVKLGVGALLKKSISSTNAIESLNSQLETFGRRVKRWQPGDMRKRWLCAAAIQAEMSMNRVRGHDSLPALIEALHRHHKNISPLTEIVQEA